MIRINEALDILYKNSKPLKTIDVNLHDAFGMVLSEDVYSDIDIPPFNKSAMDGYAVRSQDITAIPVTLLLKETIAAGSPLTGGIGGGECTKIMTGAPVPEGADAVIIIEETEEQKEGHIRIKTRVKPGQHICKQGEDIRRNQRVLRRGMILRGPEIAVLSSVGKNRVQVHRKPFVSVLSTGSEIVEPDIPLEKGKIRNSNGPMLRVLLNALHIQAHYLGIGGDREEELTALIREGLRGDIMLISGGVSMGDYDLIPALLKRMGAAILFHKVKIKPGKPLLFAKRGDCIIFGVPGNPVSNFTTFHLFIKSAIYKLTGREDFQPSFIALPVTQDVEKKGERAQLMPSIYRVREGRCEVTPLKLNGSADIIGCAGCNCLVLIEENDQLIRKGERVPVMLLD